MSMIPVSATHGIRDDRLGYHMLFGAAYPLFIAAELINRLVLRAQASDPAHAAGTRSVMAEARENTLIAISYAVMFRTSLRSSARHPRTEHLS